MSESGADDVLEGEFIEIWRALAAAEVAPLAVAGGQGLLLKQNWLRGAGAPQILIPLESWRDGSPRATKDFDLVVDLAFMANRETQGKFSGVLDTLGFVATERGPRWQFKKKLAEQNKVLVEFHAETPPKDMEGVDADRIRIKHRPSLGQDGVHARNNPEASGCHLHPYFLKLGGLEVSLPNPVTWSVMKLTAMADCHGRSNAISIDQKEREFLSSQAGKHAADVCRIVAMTSQEEDGNASAVIGFLKGRDVFIKAIGIAHEYFADDGWGTANTDGAWNPADHAEIRRLLLRWFT
jgi:hypothetical protein